MELIISGTNRKGSYSLQIAQIVQNIYKSLGKSFDLLDLAQIPFQDTFKDPYGEVPSSLKPFIEQVEKAPALVIVCPEYNGGFPGILKYFIDYWSFPKSFIHKPLCLIGIGNGLFGALRPVEHLQSIFLYRSGYICPEKVFIANVQSLIQNGEIKDSKLQKRLEDQAAGFLKYCSKLV